jgi:hypothetical protein
VLQKLDYTHDNFKKDFNVRATGSKQNNQEANPRRMAGLKSN